MINIGIPEIFFFVTLVIGIGMFIVGFFGLLGGKDHAIWVVAIGIIAFFGALWMLSNLPINGPYFEDPEPEKMYKVQGTIRLSEKYVSGLIEWSPSTKAVIPRAEIFNGSKDKPGFESGDCVSLQNGELKVIIVQGCGNNS